MVVTKEQSNLFAPRRNGRTIRSHERITLRKGRFVGREDREIGTAVDKEGAAWVTVMDSHCVFLLVAHSRDFVGFVGLCVTCACDD